MGFKVGVSQHLQGVQHIWCRGTAQVLYGYGAGMGTAPLDSLVLRTDLIYTFSFHACWCVCVCKDILQKIEGSNRYWWLYIR